MRRLIVAVVLAAAAVVMIVLSPARATGYDTTMENQVAGMLSAKHRAACGTGYALRPYQHNRLDRWRSYDMASRNYFSHTILGTSRNVFSYMSSYGIRDRLGAGEIIGWNNFPADVAAQQMIDGWMNSDGHRAVIEWCAMNTFGIGIYELNGKRYFTATFSEQPVETVRVSSTTIRSGPGFRFATRAVATYGLKTYVFKHHKDRRGRRWNYAWVATKGWGWVPAWRTW